MDISTQDNAIEELDDFFAPGDSWRVRLTLLLGELYLIWH
jgi:hypothetical protein